MPKPSEHKTVQARILKYADAALPGAGSRFSERRVHGPSNKIMHRTAVTEAYLVLRRVRIHIDAGGIDIEIQDIGGMPAMEQDVAESRTNGMRHDLVANHAAIQKKVLQIRLAARKGRVR